MLLKRKYVQAWGRWGCNDVGPALHRLIQWVFAVLPIVLSFLISKVALDCLPCIYCASASHWELYGVSKGFFLLIRIITVPLFFSVRVHMCNANVQQCMHMRGIVLAGSSRGNARIGLRYLYRDKLYMAWSVHYRFLLITSYSFISFSLFLLFMFLASSLRLLAT